MTNSEYPENREWKQKAFGMPKLPSGDMGQDKVLYYILKMVKDGKSANTMFNIEGSNSTATLGRMCEWIRPIGLVNKEKQVWTLTELGEMVLERQDSCFSTAVFCSTIVFMGEILFYLQKPKNSQELLKIAEEYHLNWKTNSEIHNRIKWFRDVDMVRFEEYKLEYSLTQKGQEFLQQIEVTMPSETEEEPDETLLETQLPMSEWASALKPATTEKKRMAIGYMPGKTADACITISAYLQLMNQAISIEEIREYSKINYQIAVSSSNMFLSFLEKIGFVDRISKNMYVTSELGNTWIEKQSPVDLIACLEARYLFVYELLAELRKEPKNAKTLSIIAKVSYGFDRESIEETRKRLILLSAAKLIYSVTNDKYGLTARGEKLLDTFGIVAKESVKPSEIKKEEKAGDHHNDSCESLITELRLSSKDSYNPNRFEKKNIFSISLQNLDRTDTFGCLRGYSKSQNLPFSETDIDFFTQILTGYPPQIRYCVDLALAEKSIEFVKSNSYLIAEFPTANSAKMLNLVIEDECRSEYNNILTLLSQMNPTPLSFIHEIAQLNPIYDDILRKLRTFSICSFSGASGEYVKINTMIGDYILRSSFELSEEIKQIINNKIAVFSQNINNKDYMQYLAFPEFNFYVKEQLKKKETLPTRFLYSTVYVQSIVELYNKAQYIQVINLVKDMKDSGLFENSEKDTQSIIQFYYCSSLARRKSIEFESEVSFFADSDSYLSYNFLKGFNYRIQGKFQFAENSYLKVLERNPKHDKARRELVQLYINMQDYDIAYDLSKQNYNEYPDNIYQMQAYFDCLIHKLPLDSFQLQDVHDIIKNAENIYKTNATDIYFQLKAKYYAFIEKEKSEAIKIINEGLKKYPKSFYLCKDLFDIYRKYEDIHGMEIAFSQLSSIPNEGNANFNIALKCREAYLKAYKGVSPIAIGLSLKSSSNYLTDNAYNTIMKNIDIIHQNVKK